MTDVTGVASYFYNGLGQRTAKNSNGTLTRYAYDENARLIGEYNATGQAIQETVYLFGQPIAVLKGTEVYNVHADHLGSPRKITSQAGNIVWQWQDKPFGDSPVNQDPDGNGVAFEYNLRFPGQYFDAETGLHYNWNRYYDPETGRYITSDPIGLAGGLNTYLYANANPIKYIDPTGNVAIADDIIIGGGIIVGACIATNCTAPIADLIEDIVDKVSDTIEQCKNDDDKPCDLVFVREMPSYDGKTKTCWYQRKGTMFTFPQAVGYACPPVDVKTCMVDTSFIMPPARY